MPSGAERGSWLAWPERRRGIEPAADGKEPTGDAIARAIRAALTAADIKPGDIGHVNAHGNSTREDDPIEARAIRETLGDVPVTAPKSYFGNLGQGSGMVELVDQPAGNVERRGAADAELRNARSGMPGECGHSDAAGKAAGVHEAEPQRDGPGGGGGDCGTIQ